MWLRDETKDAGNFNAAPKFTSQYFGYMPGVSNVCITTGVSNLSRLRLAIRETRQIAFLAIWVHYSPHWPRYAEHKPLSRTRL
jgi:hypothetical protein